MKKVVVSLVSAAALATITAGMAAGNNSTVASSDNNYQSYFAGKDAGVYVSGNIGWGHIAGTSVAGNTLAKNQKNGFAYGADLGYQFNQYSALELGYLHINEYKNTAGAKHNLAALYLVGKGILPINEQLNLFGKVGAARMNDSVTTSNTSSSTHKYVPIIGAGASYAVNENVSVNVQDLYTFESAKFNGVRMPATNSILAGVSYKFNAA